MPSNQPKWVLGTAAGLVLLAIALICLREYNQQLDSAKSDGVTIAKNQCAADTNAALLLSTQKALATVQKQLKDADDAVVTLRQQKAATDKQLKQLQGEIKYVTSTWRLAKRSLSHCLIVSIPMVLSACTTSPLPPVPPTCPPLHIPVELRERPKPPPLLTPACTQATSNNPTSCSTSPSTVPAAMTSKAS